MSLPPIEIPTPNQVGDKDWNGDEECLFCGRYVSGHGPEAIVLNKSRSQILDPSTKLNNGEGYYGICPLCWQSHPELHSYQISCEDPPGCQYF